MRELSETELSDDEIRILRIVESWTEPGSVITQKGQISMAMELARLYESLTGRTITPEQNTCGAEQMLDFEDWFKQKNGFSIDVVISKGPDVIVWWANKYGKYCANYRE